MSLKLQLTRLLKLLQCFIISVAGTCLQFTGLKTCNWHKIDFQVQHFVGRFSCFSLVAHCYWTV